MALVSGLYASRCLEMAGCKAELRQENARVDPEGPCRTTGADGHSSLYTCTPGLMGTMAAISGPEFE